MENDPSSLAQSQENSFLRLSDLADKRRMSGWIQMAGYGRGRLLVPDSNGGDSSRTSAFTRPAAGRSKSGSGRWAIAGTAAELSKTDRRLDFCASLHHCISV